MKVSKVSSIYLGDIHVEMEEDVRVEMEEDILVELKNIHVVSENILVVQDSFGKLGSNHMSLENTHVQLLGDGHKVVGVDIVDDSHAVGVDCK